MGRTEVSVSFAEWLRGELEDRGWGVRTLARRMNPEQPEIARRALNRYLHEGSFPTDANRRLIALGLGVDEAELPDAPFRPEVA